MLKRYKDEVTVILGRFAETPFFWQPGFNLSHNIHEAGSSMAPSAKAFELYAADVIGMGLSLQNMLLK